MELGKFICSKEKYTVCCMLRNKKLRLAVWPGNYNCCPKLAGLGYPAGRAVEQLLGERHRTVCKFCWLRHILVSPISSDSPFIAVQ